VFYLPLLLGMLHLAVKAAECRDPQAALPTMRLAMLLGGLAIQIKYMALPQCLFFGLVALWQLRRLGESPARLAGHAAGFALIGLAPTLAVAAGYALAGHFSAFWFANFASIFLRGSLPLAASEQYLRWIGWGSSWLWALALIGAGLVFAGRRAARPGYGLVAGFLAASLVALVMIGNIYVHYFIPAAVALAILGAPALSGGLAGRVLALVALWLAFNFTHFDALAERGIANRKALPRIAALVRPYVGAQGPCLYVHDGPVALYRATGACLPTRYVYPDHLNNALEMPAIGVDPAAEVRRILAARPGAIVVADKTPAARPNRLTGEIVAAALKSGYTRLAQARFGPQLLDIHVRSDLLASQGTTAP
jgi:hypothetical protein